MDMSVLGIVEGCVLSYGYQSLFVLVLMMMRKEDSSCYRSGRRGHSYIPRGRGRTYPGTVQIEHDRQNCIILNLDGKPHGKHRAFLQAVSSSAQGCKDKTKMVCRHRALCCHERHKR